jgi:hypothetical protein
VENARTKFLKWFNVGAVPILIEIFAVLKTKIPTFLEQEKEDN